jgi:LysR family transcriptional regulator, carnitine catabolism transcriptional activator
MDVRQLAYVLAVVDEGTFTRAAEVLQVAQPSLSQGIRTLEHELGTELFRRQARPVRLTAAGEALVEPARRAVRDVQTARAAVEAVRGLDAGHLDLVSLPTLSIDPVAGIVGQFRRAHPSVGVRLLEPDDDASVASLVRSGACELGACEIPLADVAGLVVHELAEQHYVAVLPPGARPESRRRLSIRDLAALPLVTTPRGTSTRRVLEQALEREGATAHIAVETQHREALVPLVLAGAGAALVPDTLAGGARDQGAVTVPLDRSVSRGVGLIHPDGPLSPAAAAFLALAVPGHGGARRPRPRQRPR